MGQYRRSSLHNPHARQIVLRCRAANDHVGVREISAHRSFVGLHRQRTNGPSALVPKLKHSIADVGNRR